MGLDMYLEKKTYVGNNWVMEGEELKVTIETNEEFKHIKEERIVVIVERIGYWRKANAIHNWFVKNVQNGEDDCGSYWVSKAKLEELLETVNQVLDGSVLIDGKVVNGWYANEDTKGKMVANMEDGKLIEDSSLAEELLPTTSGFFFGNTDYDQWYYEDLKDTKKILEEALQEEGGEFYYQSSW